MGEMVAFVELENTADRDNTSEELRDESKIPRTRLEGVADTGAVMPVLPENVVGRLGLMTQREFVVIESDEHKKTRPVAKPMTIRIGSRFKNTDAIVRPSLSETLIRQAVLEAQDLVVDCANRTVALRPESPDSPLLNLK